MKNRSIYSLLALTGLLISCGTENKKETQEEENVQSAPHLILLSNEQFSNLSIELGSLAETKMSAVISATGLVDVPPENIAQVSAAVNGKISRMTHNVLPGKYVAKGSILATAESMELIQLQQDYLQAYLKNEVLSRELDRQRQLLSQEAGIEKKVQEAENQWKLHKSLIAAFEARLRIARVDISRVRSGEISESMAIYSPISGFIKTVNVNTGSGFTASDILFEIISKEHLHVELKVFEKDAPYLKEGQKVRFHDPVSGKESIGSVFLVAKNFEQESKTVNVHVHLDQESDEARLIPGQYLRGEIQVEERNVQALPESALIREADGNFVLVQKSENLKGIEIEKIPVETGIIQNGLVEIISPAGLQKVIIKGGQRIAGMSAMPEED